MLDFLNKRLFCLALVLLCAAPIFRQKTQPARQTKNFQNSASAEADHQMRPMMLMNRLIYHNGWVMTEIGAPAIEFRKLLKVKNSKKKN